MIGQVVGNYKIVEKIGQGGMGAVFRGRDLMLERDVAVKVLRPDVAGQPNLVERFRSEAMALARLNHPNIATLYTFLREGDAFYMIMEYVRGQALDSYLRLWGAIPYNNAIPLFCQALEGIEHAHQHGIIHRDIKPANLLLNELGLIKVTDFGIARVLGESGLTKTGRLIGTLAYMSPEQIRGQEIDYRSDIFSLGILLYEMLGGRTPFSGPSEYEAMRAQVENDPPPLNKIVAIPEALEAAVYQSLAKDPAARFHSASGFRDALLATDPAFSSISGHYRSPLQSAYHLPAPPTRISADNVLTADSQASAINETVAAKPPAPETIVAPALRDAVPPPTVLAQAPPLVVAQPGLAGSPAAPPGRATGGPGFRPKAIATIAAGLLVIGGGSFGVWRLRQKQAALPVVKLDPRPLPAPAPPPVEPPKPVVDLDALNKLKEEAGQEEPGPPAKPAPQPKRPAAKAKVPPAPKFQVPPGVAPLQSDEVIDYLRKGATAAQVTQAVRKRGVSFSATAPVLKNIRDAGGDAGLLAAIIEKAPAEPAKIEPPAAPPARKLGYDELVAKARQTRDPQQGEAYLREATGIDAQRPDAFWALTTMRLRAGEFDKAIESARATLARGGNVTVPVTHHHRIGSCHGTLRITQGGLSFSSSEGKDSFNAARTDITEITSTSAGFQMKVSGRHYKFSPAGDFRSGLTHFVIAMLER